MSLLEVKHISKRFGGLKAINDVSFAVKPAEVTFIVGPNGAGKTTLFNLITGVFHCDSGSIHFDGRDISHSTPNQAARMGIGRTFQIVKPLRNLTVLENVMLGAFLRTSSRAKAEEAATKVLHFLEMDKMMHLPARGMGLPVLKRLEIARALATQPKLILLDEVVAGLPTPEAIKARHAAQAIAGMGNLDHRRHRARHASRHAHCRPRYRARSRHADRRRGAQRRGPSSRGDRSLPRQQV